MSSTRPDFSDAQAFELLSVSRKQTFYLLLRDSLGVALGADFLWLRVQSSCLFLFKLLTYLLLYMAHLTSTLPNRVTPKAWASFWFSKAKYLAYLQSASLRTDCSFISTRPVSPPPPLVYSYPLFWPLWRGDRCLGSFTILSRSQRLEA